MMNSMCTTSTQKLVGWSFILCHCFAWLSPQSASSFNVNSERHNGWWMEDGDDGTNNPSRSYSNDDRSSLGGLVAAGSSNNNNNPQSQNLKSSLLTLVRFSNKSITCNDGSTAGYYVRKAAFKSNPDWIIFLEGGWYCFDERSCQNRWTRLKNLMSSTGWSPTRTANGILSSDPNENPYWWNANHVLVPYCSSDTWSGTVTNSGNSSQFSFMGALIIDQVIRNLIALEGLNAESTLILAGSSAGGTGVIINLDRVQFILREEFGVSTSESPRVRGIADSGWFIDKLPSFSEKVDCHDVILCPPEVSLRKGMNLWNARLPENCKNSYLDEPWSCFFGYKIYPTLKAPLFVFQWLFDEAQMLVNNVPTPAVRKEEWDYVYRVGNELKKTLINVTSVMIPSCISHTILTHRDWKRVEVNSVYLPRALKCWESGGIIEESNFIPSSRSSSQDYWEFEEESSLLSTNSEGRGNSSKSNRRRLLLPSMSSSSSTSFTEASEVIHSNDSSRRNRRRHNRHRKNKRHRHRGGKKFQRQKLEQELLRQKQQNKTNNISSPVLFSSSSGGNNVHNHLRNSTMQQKRLNGNSPRKHLRRKFNNQNPNTNGSKNVKKHNNNNSNNDDGTGNKKRNRRWSTLCGGGKRPASNGNSGTNGLVGDKVTLTHLGGGDMRLIEKCSWPQCNKSCPKLLNPVTGEEVDFKDLLKSFGLDMATMADALGIDLTTLNSMDHQVLLKMLTQNA